MDKFQELKVFAAVAETGGFAKAASRLNSSPPAVTRAIAGLEERLGVVLFARTTRRVHLTEKGRLFLERARALLSGLDAAEREAAGEGSVPSGQLSMTAPVMMGRTILPAIVTAFLNAHPRVTAKVVLLDRTVNLVEEGLDLAVRVGRLPDSSLIARPVGEVRRLLVASPGYVAKHGKPRAPTDLKQHAVIAFTGLMPGREWTYQGEKVVSRVTLGSRFEVNDASAAIAAVEAGEGIANMLSYMVAQQIRDGRLVPILERFALPPVPVQLVYPESRIVAAKVRSFVDFAAPRLKSALQVLSPKPRPSARRPR